MAFKTIGHDVDGIVEWRTQFLKKLKPGRTWTVSQLYEMLCYRRKDYITYQEFVDLLMSKGYTVEGDNVNAEFRPDYSACWYTDEAAKLFHFKRCDMCGGSIQYNAIVFDEVDWSKAPTIDKCIELHDVYCSHACRGRP
jgi:hypothetical protein